MTDKKMMAVCNLQDPHCVESMPTGGAMVIFGASGDLTKRKLIPALYSLYKRGLLSEAFAVIGVARTAMGNVEFRNEVIESLATHGEKEDIVHFSERFFYVAGGYDLEATYQDIEAALKHVNKAFHTEANAVFYMATPPTLFLTIAKGLYEAGLLSEEEGWRRLIIEKPIGRDLASALALDKGLKKYAKEEQIYRIDHYLGKETVQNILMLRFANAIFEPLWNARYIDRVEITVVEEIGIGSRAGYYDKAGALRDMFQNHMLQMFALIAMEPPATFSADAYRNEVVKLLDSLTPITDENIEDVAVRAQYKANADKHIAGYLEEENIPKDSLTETYVAMRLEVENWRWTGVPFYIRTGKRFPAKKSEIAIFFKEIPHSIFKPLKPEDFNANMLLLRMQPDEGMSLSMEVKAPGSRLGVNTLEMNFSYSDFMTDSIPDAYERLLLDGMLGDQSLFVRHDAVEASWRYLMPLLEAWEKNDTRTPLYTYEAGTDGPKEADALLKGRTHAWRKL